MLTDKLTTYLETLPPTRDKRELTISSLGHCGRQLAYRYHGQPGLSLDARSIITLDTGTVLHHDIRRKIRAALKGSCYRLWGFPKEIVAEVHVGPYTIPGHADGILKHIGHCTKPGHKDKLLEVKTMSEFSYRRFVNGEIEQSYLDQVYGYLDGLGLTEVLFLGLNKNTGEIHEEIRTLDKDRLKARLELHRQIFESHNPEEIPTEHTPNSKGALPWQCNYCPFVLRCYEKQSPKKIWRHKYVLTQ